VKWLTMEWWRYLLSDNTGWRNVICRARGHAGPVFYNVGGTQPDWHCRGCDEYLG
jgi:hypothetical protein